MTRTTSIVAAAFAVALLASPPPVLAANDGYTPAQTAVFGTQHLASIEAPVTLRYDYRRSGRLGDGFTDRVEVIVTEVLADGRKNLAFHYLSGERERRFPVVEGFRSNPLIMLFLQDDVERMAEELDGHDGYFRNRIRQAFRDRAEVEEVPVDFAGRQVTATRVTIRPYVGDANSERFPRFVGKEYEFLLSDEVPGGIYRIRTRVPAVDGGEPLREESLTLIGTTT